MARIKYRLIIFDSDGTLADTLPWMRSVFNELADKHGFRRLTPEEVERNRDLHGHEMLKALGLPLWKLPFVVSDMRRRMERQGGDFKPFPGIGEALQRLAGTGARLAVVSSNSQRNVEQVLGEFAAHIHVFSCSVAMFGKAARLRAVTRESGIPAAQAIYIGDEVRDAEAARKAGMAFGAVAWGLHSAGALQARQPAEFFTTVSDLAARLV